MILIAHRGFTPENRMSAFRKCTNNNIKAIELDVRLSKDLKPVVIHDSSIKRVTNHRGYVSKLTSEELAKYDIPTLNNVLELLKPVSTTHLYVEIKDIGRNNNILAEKVVTAIQSFEMISKCSIISFSPQILKKVKALLPEINTGYLYGPFKGKDPLRKMKACDANMLWLHHSLINKEIIEKGVNIYAWTVNDLDTAIRLKNIGISGLVTDIPNII